MAEKIYCNKCGEELSSFDIITNVNIITKLGFGSKYDGELIHINFCLGCIDELIEQCVISPFLYCK